MRRLSAGMMRKGHAYTKAGICLMDLARPDELQTDLLTPARVGDDKLMATLDAINRRFGRNVAGLGATGWQRKAVWHSRQEHLSARYTTRLSDIPRANC